MEREEAKKYVDAVFGVAWKELTRETGPRANLTWDTVFEAAFLHSKSLDISGTQLELGSDMNGFDSITVDHTRNDFEFAFSRGEWGDGTPFTDIVVNNTSIIGISDNEALDEGFRQEILEILRTIGSKKFK